MDSWVQSEGQIPAAGPADARSRLARIPTTCLGTHRQVSDVAARRALPPPVPLPCIFFMLRRIRRRRESRSCSARSCTGTLSPSSSRSRLAACQYWLQRLFGEPFPPVLFPLAVLAASWAGGLAAGLLATVGSTLAFLYLPGRPAAVTQTTQASELVLLLSSVPLGLPDLAGHFPPSPGNCTSPPRRRLTSRSGWP